ncbi:MAG: twin-arginine translocase TatA/TatE family subunit [Deltaproteobacteria bacterium]|nr:twin-arginine translocase TatA/TatE family subunit [Deltaproteobacteria bacterium]
MQELLVIMVIVLLLFGGSRLPGIAAGLGGAVNSFKKALKGSNNDDDAAPEKVPTPQESTSNKQG